MHVQFEARDLTFTLTEKCKITGEIYSVTVPALGYIEWKHGKSIELALPNLRGEDRVFLAHGISPKGRDSSNIEGIAKKAQEVAESIHNDSSKALLSIHETAYIENKRFIELAGIMIYHEFERQRHGNPKATK